MFILCERRNYIPRSHLSYARPGNLRGKSVSFPISRLICQTLGYRLRSTENLHVRPLVRTHIQSRNLLRFSTGYSGYDTKTSLGLIGITPTTIGKDNFTMVY